MPDPGKRHPTWDRELDGPPPARATPFRGGTPEKAKAGRRAIAARLREWLISPGFAAFAGIIAPIPCLYLDPLFFQGGDEDGPWLGRYRTYCYGFMLLQMTTLAAWLLLRARLGPACGVVAGMLFAGALFAACFGVLLLPLSLIALLFLIGVLGFTPWLTAVAYLRQGEIAWDAAESRSGRRPAAAGMLIGLAIAFGLPAWARREIHRDWQRSIAAVADGDRSALGRARFWYGIVDVRGPDHPFREAIWDEPDPARKARLSEVGP
ncbi:hypothetical protein TA3x_001901 [Tundrisphaera sp. TA3]|uniref:hypothetical protein n=1 Tax=Tundrisphaera sp. TA3 TaxID=3435775 RepID=UPI003EB91320